MVNNNKYKVCSRCVMDTSDSEIVFDSFGICNHCHNFDNVTKKVWFPNDEGKRKLESIFAKIKKEGKGQDYDCIIGLSGGVDSSYLALILKDYNIKPLVVHVDAGWNSELAVYNIEQIVKHCNYDLHTHVVDWEEVKDLQLAYLKSGVANQDAVQDHVFFASLYHFAVKNNIKYVISGGNIATECVFPNSWHHAAMDAINLKSIHKKFGRLKLRNYKTIGFLKYFFYYPFVKGMTPIRPLNYMVYDKSKALKELQDKIGYKDYGRKHGESRFTKFFQNHYLPVKFGIDKRKAHLASMILTGLISRDQALVKLSEPLYDSKELADDKIYIAKKLGITESELEQLTLAEGKSYREYRNWDLFYGLLLSLKKLVVRLTGRNVKSYS